MERMRKTMLKLCDRCYSCSLGVVVVGFFAVLVRPPAHPTHAHTHTRTLSLYLLFLTTHFLFHFQLMLTGRIRDGAVVGLPVTAGARFVCLHFSLAG